MGVLLSTFLVESSTIGGNSRRKNRPFEGLGGHLEVVRVCLPSAHYKLGDLFKQLPKVQKAELD
jgi:hypothetical protein